MRALGPGSVSSFLKVILDVFYYVLWTTAGVIALAALVVILLSFKPDLLGHELSIDTWRIAGPHMVTIAAVTLVALGLYVGGTIVIVGRLRRIFRTLIVGDPFHPDNVRRLRIIAATLGVLEIGRNVASALSHMFLPPGSHIGGGVSLTTWFAVLVILVLAEVFREGARLRREAELTI
ncbi:MAG TPA: DUF2975 domain-containing protein [Caulobacteraceae bacterium]